MYKYIWKIFNTIVIIKNVSKFDLRKSEWSKKLKIGNNFDAKIFRNGDNKCKNLLMNRVI